MKCSRCENDVSILDDHDFAFDKDGKESYLCHTCKIFNSLQNELEKSDHREDEIDEILSEHLNEQQSWKLQNNSTHNSIMADVKQILKLTW